MAATGAWAMTIAMAVRPAVKRFTGDPPVFRAGYLFSIWASEPCGHAQAAWPHNPASPPAGGEIAIPQDQEDQPRRDGGAAARGKPDGDDRGTRAAGKPEHQRPNRKEQHGAEQRFLL